MSEEPIDFAREYFRRTDAKLDRVLDGLAEMLLRFRSIEEQMLLIRKDFLRLEHRFDAFDGRLNRMERRLDMADARLERIEGKLDLVKA